MDKFYLTTSKGKVPYTIFYSSKRKTVGIYITKSTFSVEVRAPFGYSESQLHEIVAEKADWIINSLIPESDHKVNEFFIDTNDRRIPYNIIYSSKRKTVSITIRKSTLSVEVKAPNGYSTSQIHKFVSEKTDWIVKNIIQIEERNISNPKTEYTDGSKHLFLGEYYTLKIELGRRSNIEIIGDIIYVKVSKQENVEKALRNWYKIQAELLFPDIISKEILDFSNKFNRCPSSVEYRYSISYWGLCSQDMRIKLNVELIRSKERHIRYIMCHELCHLVHRNHSKQFYDLLVQICPNWKDLSKELTDLVRIR